jgi:hypothetical protein
MTDGADTDGYEPINRAPAHKVPAAPPSDSTVGPPPITPLGMKGNVFFYLTPSGGLREMQDARHTINGLGGLFEGDTHWMQTRFPADKSPYFDQHSVAFDLIRRAAACGYFDVSKVRAAGAWRLEDRQMIIHSGDELLLPIDAAPDGVEVRNAEIMPGYGWIDAGVTVENKVYPSSAALPKPSKPASAGDMAGLMDFLNSWNWEAPIEAPRLLLGWLGCAQVAGALPWRPHVWIVGQGGGGKSSLEELVGNLLGSHAVKASTPTEFAIREMLSGAAVPVLLDEVEGEPEDRLTMRKLVGLAKVASSDSQSAIARGTPGGGGVKQWPIRSAFWFSSILHVDLRIEDRQRITVLELAGTPTGDSASFEANMKKFSDMGPALLGRILQGWGRFAATFDTYRRALTASGNTKRQADQLGALLAMADILMTDDDPDPVGVRELVDTFDVGEFTGHDEDQDWHECLIRLLTWPVTVNPSGEGTYRAPLWEILNALKELPQHYYIRAIRLIGVTVKQMRPPSGGEELCLFIPNKHAGLESVYEGKRWSNGVWAQSLKRYPGSFASASPVTVGGRGNTSRGRWIPLSVLPDLDPGGDDPG